MSALDHLCARLFVFVVCFIDWKSRAAHWGLRGMIRTALDFLDAKIFAVPSLDNLLASAFLSSALKSHYRDLRRVFHELGRNELVPALILRFSQGTCSKTSYWRSLNSLHFRMLLIVLT